VPCPLYGYKACSSEALRLQPNQTAPAANISGAVRLLQGYNNHRGPFCLERNAIRQVQACFPQRRLHPNAVGAIFAPMGEPTVASRRLPRTALWLVQLIMIAVSLCMELPPLEMTGARGSNLLPGLLLESTLIS